MPKTPKTYDVIVIGAGNGGMTGALTLRKGGKKVLLIEQHNIPGGAATSFVRGRFEFEVSLHQLYGIGPDPDGTTGPVRAMYEELGVFDKLKFVFQKEAFHFALKGIGELAPPDSEEGWIQYLKAAFPDEAQGIDDFQKIINDSALEMEKLIYSKCDGISFTEENFPCLFKYGNMIAKEMLDKTFKNPLLKGIYIALWGYLGVPVDRCPLTVFASMYVRSGGTWHVEGGSQAMSNAVVNTFVDLGGELKLNTKVTSILVEDNAVKGVVTEDGETYFAPVILCNNSRIGTYVNLIDNSLVPESVYEDLRVSSPGQSIFGVFIGLDCPAEEVGIKHGTSFLLPPPSPNPRPYRYEVSMSQLDYSPTIYMSCYNIDNPNASPKGTSVLTILNGKAPDVFMKLPPEKYHEAKFHFAEVMLEATYDWFPEIRNHIEEIEICTPITFMRYLRSPAGCIYGVDSHMKDLLANKLDPKGPFKGLYFCGAAYVAGGYINTLTSGHAIAKLILKEFEQGELTFNDDYTKLYRYDEIKSQIDAAKIYNPDHRMHKNENDKIVNLFHPAKIEFTVTDIRNETASAKTIRLTPKGGYVPPFLPGQYINVQVDIGGIHTSRPYSISSSCVERGYYEITVRKAPDGFVSDYLQNELKIGDTIFTSGPQGNLYQFPAVHGKKLCFLAGGSGITPFMSMLQSDADRLYTDKEIVLIYGCAKEDDIIFADRLEKVKEFLPGLRVVPVISEPTENCKMRTGFITAELIKDVLGEVDDYTYFLCGPQAMYDFVEPELDKLGIKHRKIRKQVSPPIKNPEEYAGWPEGISKDDEFTVTLADGRSFKAKAGEPLLTSIERSGFYLQSHCRAGECSFCRSRLLEGKVFAPDTARVRKSDAEWGYIHPCVTYPISDIKLYIP